jgi:predicted DCC family thiol-disulfide oxidoreductase YuxK
VPPLRFSTITTSPPLLVWDGDCGFCRRSVEHLRARVGDRIEFEPYQTAHARFPDIPVEAFASAVHLVEPDRRVSRGAEAIYRALALGGQGLPLLAYRWAPGFAFLSELGYRGVAAHRSLAARVLSLLVGDLVGPPRFRLTRLVFLRLLALVYLVAFVSLAVQVGGLIGEEGLLPAGQLLDLVRRAHGGAAVLAMPTLGWLGAGDAALSWMCWGGAAAALLALLGFAQGWLFGLCWVSYLSLVHLGQDFLSFQWDVLLTEAGFLALLLAPWRHLRPRWPAEEPAPPTVAIWLLRLLLFKLMFGSGLTKLTWGDPTWRDLTALTYHYWTQPLPTPLAWYASHLPLWLQRLSCAAMLATELFLPWLVFAPRRPRRLALLGFVLLQALIAATGNYGFFNLLTIVLCVPLLDDAAWPAALRGPLLGRQALETARRPSRLTRAFIGLVAGLLFVLSIPSLVETLDSPALLRDLGRPLGRLTAAARPFLVSNSYGLFRTMTTTRPEIEIEGSLDGEDWAPLPFRYKPGAPARAPRFVAPYMPRLDWQMWFAALGAERVIGDPVATDAWLMQDDRWLARLLVGLLRGEPRIRALLARSPFGETPPRFVRLVLWQYRFTSGGPEWWARERVGVLAGPFRLPAAPRTPPPPASS